MGQGILCFVLVSSFFVIFLMFEIVLQVLNVFVHKIDSVFSPIPEYKIASTWVFYLPIMVSYRLMSRTYFDVFEMS